MLITSTLLGLSTLSTGSLGEPTDAPELELPDITLPDAPTLETDPEQDEPPAEQLALSDTVRLYAVVDGRRLDKSVRDQLGVPERAAVHIYTVDASEGDVWVAFGQHPAMQWEALDAEAMMSTRRAAIITTEAWIEDLLEPALVSPLDLPGGPTPETAVLIDGEYASEDLRHASRQPDAPWYLVSPRSEIIGVTQFRTYGAMAVAPAASTDTWDDFRAYGMSPATSASEVGTGSWPEQVEDPSWMGPIDMGDWSHHVTWR